MVTGQHQPLTIAQRKPATWLGALRGFVDHTAVKVIAAQQALIQPSQGSADNASGAKDALYQLFFEPSGVGEHGLGFGAHLLTGAGFRLGAGIFARTSAQGMSFLGQLAH